MVLFGLSLFPAIASAPATLSPQTLVYVQGNSIVGYYFAFEQTLVEWTYSQYPTIAESLIRLISCESGFNPLAEGDNSTSFGLLQFKQTTWQNYCEGDIWNSQDQINCGVKMIEKGLGPTTQGWYNCWRKMNLDKYL